jgi:hypothetical protein
MADIWLRFGMNAVVYDRQAKEVVKITNGKCTLDHSSPEGFRATHTRPDGHVGCQYVPCEAVALRCVGVDAKGNPRMAFTYRQVDPDQLSAAEESAWIGPGRFRRSLFIGRV